MEEYKGNDLKVYALIFYFRTGMMIWNKWFQESKKNWPLVITLRKTAATSEFKDPMNDNRVNTMSISKWKPIHLMIYFERLKMIDDIIEFSGRSFKKALTIDNKKLHSYDDFHWLNMWIKLKSSKTFLSIWNLANQWSIVHLYKCLEELSGSGYSEQILKVILDDKTTTDILMFWDSKIKDEIFEKIQKIINNKGDKKQSLENSLSKLKLNQPKPINTVFSIISGI